MLLNCGVGEDSWESSKEIKPFNPEGNQSWMFIGRTDAEAETPILWPPDGKAKGEKGTQSKWEKDGKGGKAVYKVRVMRRRGWAPPTRLWVAPMPSVTHPCFKVASGAGEYIHWLHRKHTALIVEPCCLQGSLEWAQVWTSLLNHKTS